MNQRSGFAFDSHQTPARINHHVHFQSRVRALEQSHPGTQLADLPPRLAALVAPESLWLRWGLLVPLARSARLVPERLNRHQEVPESLLAQSPLDCPGDQSLRSLRLDQLALAARLAPLVLLARLALALSNPLRLARSVLAALLARLALALSRRRRLVQAVPLGLEHLGGQLALVPWNLLLAVPVRPVIPPRLEVLELLVIQVFLLPLAVLLGPAVRSRQSFPVALVDQGPCLLLQLVQAVLAGQSAPAQSSQLRLVQLLRPAPAAQLVQLALVRLKPSQSVLAAPLVLVARLVPLAPERLMLHLAAQPGLSHQPAQLHPYRLWALADRLPRSNLAGQLSQLDQSAQAR